MARCFIDKELECCFSKYSPAKHFAGKEAVVKVLYGFWIKCRIENVEIINNNDGATRVNIHGINLGISGFEKINKFVSFRIIINCFSDCE